MKRKIKESINKPFEEMNGEDRAIYKDLIEAKKCNKLSNRLALPAIMNIVYFLGLSIAQLIVNSNLLLYIVCALGVSSIFTFSFFGVYTAIKRDIMKKYNITKEEWKELINSTKIEDLKTMVSNYEETDKFKVDIIDIKLEEIRQQQKVLDNKTTDLDKEKYLTNVDKKLLSKKAAELKDKKRNLVYKIAKQKEMETSLKTTSQTVNLVESQNDIILEQ